MSCVSSMPGSPHSPAMVGNTCSRHRAMCKSAWQESDLSTLQHSKLVQSGVARRAFVAGGTLLAPGVVNACKPYAIKLQIQVYATRQPFSHKLGAFIYGLRLTISLDIL